MGQRLSETELQKSLDFCVKIFNPTSPEEHARLEEMGEATFGDVPLKELLDVRAPVVDFHLWEMQGETKSTVSDATCDIGGRAHSQVKLKSSPGR